MKKLTTLLLVGLSSLAWGQRVFVSESKETIGGGSNNALTVSVYGVDAKDVEKAWKSQMKDYGAKVSNDKGGELFGDNAVIKEMGNNTVDMHSRIIDKKDRVDLIVAFDLGGAYLCSALHADKYKIAERILHDFSVKLTKDNLNEQLKAQQKQLDKLNDQQKDLVKENNNMNNEIVDYQNKIKKNQDNIEKNKNAQDAKQREIAQQQGVVDETIKKVNSVQ